MNPCVCATTALNWCVPWVALLDSIPIEARQARHAADEHVRAQRWHDGLAAYEEALSLEHTKEVHCRAQSARCLIQIADQLMRNSDGGKQKKTARLKNTIRTAQKSVTNLGAAHNIKFNAAVHELELAIAAAGGLDVTAVVSGAFFFCCLWLSLVLARLVAVVIIVLYMHTALRIHCQPWR